MTEEILYEPDDNEEAINSIPTDNLGDSGLVVYKYEEWKPGDPHKPNNVVISCIDRLSNVAIVGVDKDTGELYCASSEEDPDTVLAMLSAFAGIVEEHKEEELG